MCKFKELYSYLKVSQFLCTRKKINFWTSFVLGGKKSILVLANDPITLWMLGSFLHIPHFMLTLAVLSCISIMFLSRFNIKLPFAITSLLNILRFLLAAPPLPNNCECVK